MASTEGFLDCGSTRGTEKRLIDFFVGGVGAIEEIEEWREVAGDEIGVAQGFEIAATGFDEEGVFVEPGRGVAFAEDGELTMGRAEIVGEVEQGLARVLEGAHGGISEIQRHSVSVESRKYGPCQRHLPHSPRKYKLR